MARNRYPFKPQCPSLGRNPIIQWPQLIGPTTKKIPDPKWTNQILSLRNMLFIKGTQLLEVRLLHCSALGRKSLRCLLRSLDMVP